MSYINHIERSSVDELFKELKSRVRNEGVTTFDEYIELIDDVIEEKKGMGALGDDDDTTQIKADLELMWNVLER
jgi:hypothetical protein